MDEIYAETQRAQAEELAAIRQELRGINQRWHMLNQRVCDIEVRDFTKPVSTADYMKLVPLSIDGE